MPVDKSAPRVRRMFAAIARRYDLLNHLLSAGIDRRWRRRTVRLMPPAVEGPLVGRPILDVCTGTGDLALAYDAAGGESAESTSVIGTDFCRPMLDEAAVKLQRRGRQGPIALVEADTLRLPFPDARFQVVSVAFGLRNLADTDAGLREMARVCHPGGHVVVLEFSTPRVWPLRPLYLAYFRHVLPRIGQAVARNADAAYNYLPASVGEFPEGERLAERMRRAGLANVARHRFTLGIATLYVGEKPE
jgi:demethylmenaquinone methyltransferase/2-methoxy-6-polyprenyl-1,4-benzoquinol methylase